MFMYVHAPRNVTSFSQTHLLRYTHNRTSLVLESKNQDLLNFLSLALGRQRTIEKKHYSCTGIFIRIIVYKNVLSAL